MLKILIALTFSAVILAKSPVPSKTVTITVCAANLYEECTGNIKETTSWPSGSQIFDDEEEVLSSITTTTFNSGRDWIILADSDSEITSLSLTSLYQLTREKTYELGSTETNKKTFKNYYANLDGDPPLEIKGCTGKGGYTLKG